MVSSSERLTGRSTSASAANVICVRRRMKRSEGEVPNSMSGSCGSSVDGVLYVFGGHQARGNTNTVRLSNDPTASFNTSHGC